MHFWSKFGNPNLSWLGVLTWTNSKWGEFWPSRSRSIAPQYNRDLNQGFFYTCGPSLVILDQTGDKLSLGQARGLPHTHGHAHTGDRWQYTKAKTALGQNHGYNARDNNNDDNDNNHRNNDNYILCNDIDVISCTEWHTDCSREIFRFTKVTAIRMLKQV